MKHGTDGLVIRMKTPRHETCIQCGQDWNVSVRAKFFRGKWYICPQCKDFTCTDDRLRDCILEWLSGDDAKC